MMMLHFLCLISLFILVVSQAPLTPLSGAVDRTGGTFRVQWTPAPNDNAAIYSVALNRSHSMPSEFPKPVLAYTSFSNATSTLLPSDWSFKGGLCTVSTGACRTSPSSYVMKADGVELVPLIGHFLTQSVVGELTTQGVPIVTSNVLVNEDRFLKNTTHGMYFGVTTSNIVPSGTSAGYNAGIILYEEVNGGLRWFMAVGIYSGSPSSIPSGRAMYTSVGGSTGTRTMSTSSWGNLPGVSSSISSWTTSVRRTYSGSSGTWNLVWAAEDPYMVLTGISGSLTDASLGFHNGAGATNFRSNLFRIGIYNTPASVSGQPSYITFRAARLSMVSTTDISDISAWGAYWTSIDRNRAQYGECSVTMISERNVTAAKRSALFVGLSPVAIYGVSITAINNNGRSEPLHLGSFSASKPFPDGVPTPTLHIDARALPVVTSNRDIGEIQDLTGKWTLGKDGTRTTPLLVPPSTANPYQSFSFSGSRHWIIKGSDGHPDWGLHPSTLDMTMFAIYRIVHQSSNNFQSLLERGYGGYGSNEASYGFYAHGYKYDAASYYYRFYGAFVRQTAQSNMYAGISAQISEGNDWTPHPFSSRPGMVTYSVKNIGNSVFQTDACHGIITGVPGNDDCNANNAIGGSWRPTQTFQPGITLTHYSYGSSKNVHTMPDNLVLPPNNFVRVGAGSYLSGSTTYLSDFLNGEIVTMVFYKGVQLSNSSVRDLTLYLSSEFGLHCPAVPGNNLFGSGSPGCPVTGVGASCSASCELGTKRIFGSVSSPCTTGSYTGSPLTCAKTCPNVMAPTNTIGSSCRKTIHRETFTDGSFPSAQLHHWDTVPPLSPAAKNETWVQSAEGYLVADIPLSNEPCPSNSQTSLIMPDPFFLTTMPAEAPLIIEAEMSLDDFSQGGLIFRAVTTSTYYRLSLVNNGQTRLQKVQGGTVLLSRWSPSATLNTATGAWHRLRIEVTLDPVTLVNDIRVFVNDTLVWDVEDSSYISGSIGFSATYGVVRFRNLVLSTTCDRDGSSCLDMHAGQSCSFTCAPGYVMEAASVTTCGVSGAYDTTPRCVPLPPVLTGASVSVYDLAPAKTVLGNVSAVVMNENQAVIYRIADGNTLMVTNTPQPYELSGIFSVGACTGEITLARAGVLDYNTLSRSFTLTVEGCTNGDALACTNTTVTVSVLRSPRPPEFDIDTVSGQRSLWIRSVLENSPVGTQIANPIIARSTEGGTITYEFGFGNSEGYFSIGRTNGFITVSRAGLDFERQSRYTLVVRAFDSTFEAPVTTVLQINLVDVNDEPVVPERVALVVDETVFPNVGHLGEIRAFDEDAGANLTYHITSVQPSSYTSRFALDPLTGHFSNLEPRTYNSELEDPVVRDGYLCRDYAVFNVSVTDQLSPPKPMMVHMYIIASVAAAEDPIVERLDYTLQRPSTMGGGAIILWGTQFLSLGAENFRGIAAGVNDKSFQFSYTTLLDARWQREAPLSCVLVSDAEISCVVPVGFGGKLRVTGRRGVGNQNGRPIMFLTPLLFDYAIPQVSSVSLLDSDNPFTINNIPTVGGVRLLVRGSNFGPETVHNGTYSGAAVVYLKGSSTPVPTVYVSGHASVVYDLQNSLVVVVPPGYGPNVQLEVGIGDLRSEPFSSAFSYADPVLLNVTASDGAPLGELSTLGGDTFVLHGKNFGPEEVPVRVQLFALVDILNERGEPEVQELLLDVNCEKGREAQAHTLITCRAPAGVGRDFYVNLYVGSIQTPIVSTQVLHYRAPVVTAVIGAGINFLETMGGQQFSVIGTDIGPVTLNGNLSLVPYVQVWYGSYEADDCFISALNTISCVTVAGIGENLLVRVRVNGVDSPELNITDFDVVNQPSLSYAPPIITGFRRLDGGSVNGFLTSGGQQVIIQGRNFGTDPYVITAKYRLLLGEADSGTEVRLWGAPGTNSTLGNGGNMTFEPTGPCTRVLAHRELACTLNVGVGNNLEWEVYLEGRSSIMPVVSYAPPEILQVRDLSEFAVDEASTDGGFTLQLKGNHFGPATNCFLTNREPCVGLIQSIRFGPTGVERSISYWHVVSPTVVQVTVPPAFGRDLHFTMRVADQLSSPSVETFSFARPTMTSLTPTLSGPPTLQPPFSPLLTVVGRNFALLDPDAQVSILFGNQADQTLRPPLATQLLVPTWSDPASVAQHTPGGPHSASFFLPNGLGQLRSVRVRISSKADSAYFVDTQGHLLFNYTAPVLSAVVVQMPAVVAITMPALMPFIENHVTPGSPAFVATLLGSNFGPAASVTGDGVGRFVQFAEQNVETNFSSEDVHIFSWEPERVVTVISKSVGFLRLLQQTADPAGLPLRTFSQALSFSNIAPSVGNLVGSTGPFPTVGGNIISFEATHLGAVAASLVVRVGGRPCPLLNLAGEVVAAGDAPNAIVRNPAYYTSPTPGDLSNAVWTLRCRLPPGEGLGNAILLIRDSDISTGGSTINYIAPQITTAAKFTVFSDEPQPWGEWFETPVAPNMAPIEVGNLGGFVRLQGNNFGICPTAQIFRGSNVISFVNVALPGAGCIYAVNGSEVSELADPFGLFPAPNATHSELVFQVPPGEGVGLVLAIEVGQQSTRLTYPVQFRYAGPQIVSFTESGPTMGGTVITIRGHNFGIIQVPNVTIGGLPCPLQQRTHEELQCLLPPGAGRGKKVVVSVSGLSTTATRDFHYDPPLVTSLEPPVGPTSGNYSLFIYGENFGASANVAGSCVFMAWRGRSRTVSPLCNGLLDFLGEGELPPVAIRSWNHTLIEVIVPPGLGGIHVLPSAAGQTQRLYPLPRFDYGAPIISAEPIPNTGSTTGGYLMRINGANFGGSQLDTSDQERMTTYFPQSLATLTTRDRFVGQPRLPTAHLSVRFWRSCVTAAREMSNVLPPLLGGCSREGILTQLHDEIVLRVPGGIGRNREITVEVLDMDEDDATNAVVPVRLISNVELFHYDRPLVLRTDPFPVLQTPGKPSATLVLYGENFGSALLQQTQQWSAEERAISVNVSGLPVLSAERVTLLGEDAIQVQLPPLTVGFKNISYSVAGQSNMNIHRPQTPMRSVYIACAGGRSNPATRDPGPWSGSFGSEGEECAPCPLGAVCGGFNPLVGHVPPRPVIGWFNLNSTMLGVCPEEVRAKYPTRNVCIVPCEPPEACLADNFCSEGYASKAPLFRCSSCADGFFKRANACVRCPDSPYALVVGMIMLVVVLAGLAYYLNKKRVNIAVFSIGIDYFQVLAIFANSKIDWPEAIQELFHILSAFNLNIEIVAPECMVPDVSYKTKWSIIMALPLCIAAFFLVLSLGSACYKAFVKQQKVSLKYEATAFLSSLILIFYIFYIFLTRTVLDIYNCTPTDPPDGKTYLSAVFEECGVPGGTQMSLLPAAIIATIFYIILYPAAVAYFTWKNRELIMEDQYLRAKGTGDDRLTNPNAHMFRKRWGRLYYAFKPQFFFWTVTIILRKFFISATYILFNKNASFQLAGALLVMFLSYTLQVIYNPYMSSNDCEPVLRHLDSAAFTSLLYARLKATIAGIESRGRKTGRRAANNIASNGLSGIKFFTKDGRLNLGEILRGLRVWLFNFNTVEEILLFSATIVALMGIMFGSQVGMTSDAAQEARDAVTAVLITVVVVTIIYYILVIIAEVLVVVTETAERKRRARSQQNIVKRSDSMAKLTRKSVSTDGFIVGEVIQSTNPMMLQSTPQQNPLNSNEERDNFLDNSAIDAISQMRDPPPQELWRLYQDAYADVVSRVNEMKSRIESYPERARIAAKQQLENSGVTEFVAFASKRPTYSLDAADTPVTDSEGVKDASSVNPIPRPTSINRNSQDNNPLRTFARKPSTPGRK